jgi:light-harvesting complex I chlorophyll a/b binding protein 1
MSATRTFAARRAPRVSAPRRAVTTAAAKTSSAPSGKDYMLSLPGITAPLGFFDPLGFCNAPGFSVSEAKRFREVELTHGRVSMLATLGWIVAEEYHPLFGGEIGGPAFQHFQEIEAIVPQFWEIVLLFIGIAETARARIIYSGVNTKSDDVMNPDYNPGELGFDPLGLFPEDAEEAFDKQTKEINNGRLAMISWVGFAAQEEIPFPGFNDHVTIWTGLVREQIIAPAEANLLPF